MRKTISLLLSLLLLCALLVGCKSMDPSATRGEVYNESADADAVYDYAYEPYEEEYESPASGEGLSISGTSAEAITTNKKIIRDADCALTVEKATEAWAQIVAQVTEAGGYVSASEQWQVSEVYTSISATIRIPAGKLDSALGFLETLGEVTNLSISSSDVTDAYTDTQLRLDVKRATLTQYYKYLEEAKDIDEMLKIQRSINDLVEEIEAAEGKIRMWDNLVSESTLKIRIYEKQDPTAERREVEWNAMSADDMGYYIRNGFLGVVNTLWRILAWIGIILAITSPIWLIALAIIIPLVIHNKRKKAARLAAQALGQEHEKEI